MSDRDLATVEAHPKFGWLRFIFDLTLLWSFISALSIPLELDNWPPAVFLSYPPRALFILLAAGFATYLLLARIFLRRTRRGYWLRLCTSLVIITCCISSLGWNPLRSIPNDSNAVHFSLISANTGGHPVEFTNRLDQANAPDIICLQEASINHRQAIAAKLPNYQLFYSNDDPACDQDGALVFSNVIGLLKSTFETERAVVDSDVTGYRTFAVQTALRSEPSKSIAIVNVHTTKALAFHAGLQGFFFQTPAKSQRHVDERIAIEAWANKQPDNTAILLAGDFNAPTKTVGARFRQFTNSHLVASANSLLTFPEAWPVMGIDHVFGNETINFTKSEVLRNETSDHRYRRVEFNWSGP